MTKSSGMKLITVNEAWNVLDYRVDKSTIRRWVRTGKWGVRGGRRAGRVMVDRDSLPTVEEYYRNSA